MAHGVNTESGATRREVVLSPVDWHQPWLAPFSHFAGAKVDAAEVDPCNATISALLAQLNLEGRAPVRFVPQSVLPRGVAYEQFIFDTGLVPTRDNLHDFFNGLCWITFAQIKKKLNQLQVAEMARADIRKNVRGAVRDALTLFDENAAFLMAPQVLWDALAERDWKRLFVALRPRWQEAQLVLFGHALLEKLVYPRKPITAHVYRLQPAATSIAALDAAVASSLSAEKLATKPFLPLPVLGVPGWWVENENFSFYDDPLVFRPRANNNQ